MKRFSLLLLCLNAFNLFAQQKDPGNISPSKDVYSDIKATIDVSALSGYNNDVLLTNFHRFLDTASLYSIDAYLLLTSDSVLQIIYDEAETITHQYYEEHPYSNADMDGDGHASYTNKGDDCDDLNPQMYPGHPERCNGYTLQVFYGKKYLLLNKFLDEDCDPATIASNIIEGDGDNDGDGEISCSCRNEMEYIPPSTAAVVFPKVFIAPSPTHAGYFIVKGKDCDDNNFSLKRESEKCINEHEAAICINGKWQTVPCTKCVTQANGSGVIVEW